MEIMQHTLFTKVKYYENPISPTTKNYHSNNFKKKFSHDRIMTDDICRHKICNRSLVVIDFKFDINSISVHHRCIIIERSITNRPDHRTNF